MCVPATQGSDRLPPALTGGGAHAEHARGVSGFLTFLAEGWSWRAGPCENKFGVARVAKARPLCTKFSMHRDAETRDRTGPGAYCIICNDARVKRYTADAAPPMFENYMVVWSVFLRAQLFRVVATTAVAAVGI